MHIGVIAPPWFPIPPDGYGGIERVIYDLVEAFTDAGHRVSLFAPSGSQTSADLVPLIERGCGLDLPASQRLELLHDYGKRALQAGEQLDLDVVCDHTEAEFEHPWPVPVMRIIHGAVTATSLLRCQRQYRAGEHLVGISQRQATLFATAAARRFGTSALTFDAAIHNPSDVVHVPFYPAQKKEHVAAYVGRCHPEKGPMAAIEVALRAGVPLRMAMRVSEEERPYFESEVQPLLRWAADQVEFVGEVRGQQRDDLFGQAKALIFSSTWEEPFGLSITEALSRGTPVAALRRGSAPELIIDEVTGALTSDFDAMADRLREVMALDPQACRADAMQRFDRARIAAQHISLMEQLIQPHQLMPAKLPASRGHSGQSAAADAILLQSSGAGPAAA